MWLECTPKRWHSALSLDKIMKAAKIYDASVTRDKIRLVGMFTILIGIAYAALFLLNRGAAAEGGRDLSSSIYEGVYFITMGVGLFLRYRIFAVMAALPLMAFGLWNCWLGLYSYSPLIILVNFAIGLVFLIPAYITIKHWKSLKVIGRTCASSGTPEAGRP